MLAPCVSFLELVKASVLGCLDCAKGTRTFYILLTINLYSKMKHKIYLLIVAVMQHVAFCYAGVVSGTCGNNLTWTLNTKDSTLVIEGTGDMYYSGEVPPWYDYTSYIYYVSLPEGLTSIGKHAFSGTKIRSITIPKYITNIGGDAFLGCLQLGSVVINSNDIMSNTSGIRKISGYFGNNVKHYIIGESVKEIGEYAFIDSAIESVILSEGLTRIGQRAFSGCAKLKSINLPNSTISIGKYAFWNCKGLTSIIIPDNVSDIGDHAFLTCTNINTASIGRKVTNITDVFKFCTGITKFIVHAPIPPEGGVTNYLSQNQCTLYVHRENLSVYANSVWWEDFFAIKAIEDDTSIETTGTNSTLKGKKISNGQILIECNDKIYTLTGQEVK